MKIQKKNWGGGRVGGSEGRSGEGCGVRVDVNVEVMFL